MVWASASQKLGVEEVGQHAPDEGAVLVLLGEVHRPGLRLGHVPGEEGLLHQLRVAVDVRPAVEGGRSRLLQPAREAPLVAGEVHQEPERLLGVLRRLADGRRGGGHPAPPAAGGPPGGEGHPVAGLGVVPDVAGEAPGAPHPAPDAHRHAALQQARGVLRAGLDGRVAAGGLLVAPPRVEHARPLLHHVRVPGEGPQRLGAVAPGEALEVGREQLGVEVPHVAGQALAGEGRRPALLAAAHAPAPDLGALHHLEPVRRGDQVVQGPGQVGVLHPHLVEDVLVVVQGQAEHLPLPGQGELPAVDEVGVPHRLVPVPRVDPLRPHVPVEGDDHPRGQPHLRHLPAHRAVQQVLQVAGGRVRHHRLGDVGRVRPLHADVRVPGVPAGHHLGVRLLDVPRPHQEPQPHRLRRRRAVGDARRARRRAARRRAECEQGSRQAAREPSPGERTARSRHRCCHGHAPPRSAHLWLHRSTRHAASSDRTSAVDGVRCEAMDALTTPSLLGIPRTIRPCRVWVEAATARCRAVAAHGTPALWRAPSARPHPSPRVPAVGDPPATGGGSTGRAAWAPRCGQGPERRFLPLAVARLLVPSTLGLGQLGAALSAFPDWRPSGRPPP